MFQLLRTPLICGSLSVRGGIVFLLYVLDEQFVSPRPILPSLVSFMNFPSISGGGIRTYDETITTTTEWPLWRFKTKPNPK